MPPDPADRHRASGNEANRPSWKENRPERSEGNAQLPDCIMGA
jgi:hypothetical protein